MLQQNIQTIVVGVDFSGYSKTLVQQAKLLCQLWKAKLVLVHVIQDPVEYAPVLYVPFPNRLSNEFYQEEVKKFYGAKYNSKTEIIATRGIPSDTILEVAGKYPHAMIMAGYRGVRPVAEFFFGSTAQSLILKSKLPVWIHRGTKIIKPKKILVPHDLSLESNHSIDLLKDLSLTSPFKYEVFYVHQRPYPVLDYSTYTLAEKKLMEKSEAKIKHLKKEYPKLPLTVAKGNVTNKIIKKAKNFDLLVMAHHNPSGIFSGSQTIELLKQLNKPALIVH